MAERIVAYGKMNDVKKNRFKWILSGVSLAGGAVTAGLPFRTDLTEYTLEDDRIQDDLTIVILSDFHNDYNEKGIQRLGTMVRSLNPDLILMPGDMAEEHHHQERTFEFLEQLKGIPMYYSTGNHEEYRWDLTELKDRFRAYGVVVLDEKKELVQIKRTTLEIAGISCRLNMSSFMPAAVNELFDSDHYRILLSHKPNWIELYKQIHCDLVVCGHAHGGQWHIPFVDIPVAAPSQGFFPKYTDGIHDLNGVKMLISRGLTRHYHGIPRLYNNPEIVFLKLRSKAK